MTFIQIPDTARLTVCNACLRVGCADGELQCSAAARGTAGTTQMSVGDLKSRGSTEPFLFWKKPVHA